MFFSFAVHSFSLPEITEGVYFDIGFNKRRLGRLEFGLCGKDCPNTVEMIKNGISCKKSNFCYKNTNVTDFEMGSQLTIGGSFRAKGDKPDPITGTANNAYILVAKGNSGYASGELVLTLSTKSGKTLGGNPVGKLISGQKVIEKMFVISNGFKNLDDPPSFQILNTGFVDVEDNSDIDL